MVCDFNYWIQIKYLIPWHVGPVFILLYSVFIFYYLLYDLFYF